MNIWNQGDLLCLAFIIQAENEIARHLRDVVAPWQDVAAQLIHFLLIPTHRCWGEIPTEILQFLIQEVCNQQEGILAKFTIEWQHNNRIRAHAYQASDYL